jgi:hypothetical protein
MSDASRRPWLSFSLRTLFVVVTVLAALTCWSAYQLNWIRQRREFVAGTHGVLMSFSNVRAPSGLWLFGATGVRVMLIEREGDLARCRELFPESEVRLRSAVTHEERVSSFY